MATLEGKTVLIIGGSSGIGHGVAKASLLSHASKVTIASSSKTKVDAAVERLKSETSAAGGVEGQALGEVVDAKDTKSIHTLFDRIGEIDHLVWTSGDELELGFPNIDIDASKGVFDVRFWGAVAAAQVAKIRPGGSITLTVGQAIVRPSKGWSLTTGVAAAIDGLTRGLAVDLAPIRVNVVSPGLVKTELLDSFPEEARKALEDQAKKLLLPRVGKADEIAEAYLFLMKCSYITGQRVEVDGGLRYV